MVTMPHGERPRRLPGFSAERVLIVLVVAVNFL
jgi:hypothetical protein